jgi:hypothetical protein
MSKIIANVHSVIVKGDVSERISTKKRIPASRLASKRLAKKAGPDNRKKALKMVFFNKICKFTAYKIAFLKGEPLQEIILSYIWPYLDASIV